jgi:hypothetical protein
MCANFCPARSAWNVRGARRHLPEGFFGARRPARQLFCQSGQANRRVSCRWPSWRSTKILNRLRHVAVPQIAAPADFLGEVLGEVARPPLERVEAEHPDRAVILAFDQVLDHGLKIGLLLVRFAPDAPVSAEDELTRPVELTGCLRLSLAIEALATRPTR